MKAPVQATGFRVSSLTDARFVTIAKAVGSRPAQAYLAPLLAASGLSLPALRGRRPTSLWAKRARQVGMYLLKTQTEWSLSEVGLYFDGRDHSTVHHAIKNLDRRRATDPTFEAYVASLERAIVDSAAPLSPTPSDLAGVLAGIPPKSPLVEIRTELRELRTEILGLRAEITRVRELLEKQEGKST